MQIAVTQESIPFGSLVKTVFVGYGIASLVFACIGFVLALLTSQTQVSYVDDAGPSAYLLGAVLGRFSIALQAIVVALMTAFGLWLYGRFLDSVVFFLD